MPFEDFESSLPATEAFSEAQRIILTHYYTINRRINGVHLNATGLRIMNPYLSIMLTVVNLVLLLGTLQYRNPLDFILLIVALVVTGFVYFTRGWNTINVDIQSRGDLGCVINITSVGKGAALVENEISTIMKENESGKKGYVTGLSSPQP